MNTIHVKKKIALPGKELNIQFSFDFEKGNTIGLVGPSGSGKTTILRMICGLIKPDTGKIIINDKTWFDSEDNKNIPPKKRSVGMVFQQYLLFPNMTVRENLAYATPAKDKVAAIEEVLAVVGLRSELDRKPSLLSGGQQQRIALARALIRKPDILLLDEPLSALDHELRSKLQDDLKELLSQIDIPVILVSHDQREISKLTDQIFSTTLNASYHSQYDEKIIEIIEVAKDSSNVLVSTESNSRFYLPAECIPFSSPKPGMKFSINNL